MTRPSPLLQWLLSGLWLLATAAWAAPAPSSSGKLEIHYLDVGQGDSIFIRSPAGKTVLIDGGPPEAAEHVAKRLPELTHEPLDLVILSHPHLDHLGGLAAGISAVGAKKFMDPKYNHPGKAYDELLALVQKEGIPYVTPTVDPKDPTKLVTISLGGGATLYVLWPRRPVEEFLADTRSDANSNSIVLKLVYGKTAFLLVGDAEPDTEEYLIQKNLNLRATVLKCGHHGGRHSSTTPWLERIHPKVAVISCGVDNKFGHPGAETLERLAKENTHVYRTDTMGEITALSDGNTVTMSAEREETGPTAFPGDVEGPVATGPILPGVHKPSKATLEDRKRYGRGNGDAQPDSPDPEPASPAASSDERGDSSSKAHGSSKFHGSSKSYGRGRTRSSKASSGDDSADAPASTSTAAAAPTPTKSADELIPDDVKARYPESSKAAKQPYVASTNSNVFHKADCPSAKKIKPGNRLVYATRAAAAEHHQPAEDCHP